MGQRRKVDYAYLAKLCARHVSGNHYEVVERFAACRGLTPAEKLRLKRYAERYAKVREAAERSLQALEGLLHKTRSGE